ncbi:MAG: hypothetical protein ACJ0PU_00285 [Flavobacteriaceae bacterium]
MKKIFTMVIFFLLFSCDSKKPQNKIGVQFFLDVKYPELYENAFLKLRKQIEPILDGGEMTIAKIHDGEVMNANYYTLIRGKDIEHLRFILDTIPKTQYHKDYKIKIGLEKGDVKIISSVSVEFK